MPTGEDSDWSAKDKERDWSERRQKESRRREDVLKVAPLLKNCSLLSEERRRPSVSQRRTRPLYTLYSERPDDLRVPEGGQIH